MNAFAARQALHDMLTGTAQATVPCSQVLALTDADNIDGATVNCSATIVLLTCRMSHPYSSRSEGPQH